MSEERCPHSREIPASVDCKRTAAAAGPSSRLAQSDRFVRLLSAPLVELPDMRHGQVMAHALRYVCLLMLCVRETNRTKCQRRLCISLSNIEILNTL